MIKYKYNDIEYDSLNDIKLLFPNVSFPQIPSKEDLLPMGITQEEIAEIPKTDAELLAQAQTTAISVLKSLLDQTDYEAIKYAEGVTSATQYANLKTAREAWRMAINSIQAATTAEEVNAVTYSATIPTVD